MEHLVVGMDGSADAKAALAWAEVAVGPSGTAELVHAAEPGDDPVEALLSAATTNGADGIVVGAHGTSLLVPRAIGTVASHLLRRASVPVVIVRAGAVRPMGPEGTIVVGVGHGPATRAALRWATGFAAERGTALSLVRATGTRPLFDENGLLEVIAHYLDPSMVREWAEEDLAELADEIEGSVDGTLQVSWTATSGRAGPRLVEAAADAAILVIGRERDGALVDHFTVGALRHALTHAPCPVVMVPSHDG